MTEPGMSDANGEREAGSSDAGPAPQPGDIMRRLEEADNRAREDLGQLRNEFERLAGAVMPLLTKQYSESQQRMRVLETRLRNRQERPLIIVMANLLSDVRRLTDGDDVKAHVEETLADALARAGYQEMGSVGDQFDPAWHEAVSGSVGASARSGVVTQVYSRGLACYGEVIIKARVEVGPAPEGEQGEFPS
ncbi:MAG: nucleotide exchange factor GrpE [Nocardiopsaceae bacterium]|nr:nucleotide exchange factor GrpE [Nocardiopsaceae bacterium]